MVNVLSGLLEVSRRKLRLSAFSLSTHLLMAQGISHEQEKHAVINHFGDSESEDMDDAKASPHLGPEEAATAGVDPEAYKQLEALRKAADADAIAARKAVKKAESRDTKAVEIDGAGAKAFTQLEPGSDHLPAEASGGESESGKHDQTLHSKIEAIVRLVDAEPIRTKLGTKMKRAWKDGHEGSPVLWKAFLGQLVDDGVFEDLTDLRKLKQLENIAKQVQTALINSENIERRPTLEKIRDAGLRQFSAELDERLTKVVDPSHRLSDSDSGSLVVQEIRVLLLKKLADISRFHSDVEDAQQDRRSRQPSADSRGVSVSEAAPKRSGGFDEQLSPSAEKEGADRDPKERGLPDLQAPISSSLEEEKKNKIRAALRKVDAGLIKRMGNKMKEAWREGSWDRSGVLRNAFFRELLDGDMDLSQLHQIAKQVRKALINSEENGERRQTLEDLSDANGKELSAKLNERLTKLVDPSHEKSDPNSDRLAVEVQLLLLNELADIDESNAKRAVESRSLDGWRHKTKKDLEAIMEGVKASTIKEAIESGSASSGSPDQKGGQSASPIQPSITLWNLFWQMLTRSGLGSGDGVGVTDMQESAGVVRTALIKKADAMEKKLINESPVENCNLIMVDMKNDENCFQILSGLLQECVSRVSMASGPRMWAFDEKEAKKNLPVIRVLLLTILANIDQTQFEKMAGGLYLATTGSA
ncbi:unnamed protein product [Amoebophrya sp. A25]|nr:unnamed protein product [Amoebophrya sp. A25]|eukprot:GSA25T00003053001.1